MDKFVKRMIPSVAFKTGGSMTVTSGGMVNRTKLSSDAWLTISSGGSGRNIANVNRFVSLIRISSGGTLVNTSGFDLHGPALLGGNLFISSGATVSSAFVNEGYLSISAGGYAFHVNASGSVVGNDTARGHVVIRGLADEVSIFPERDFFILDGGYGSGIYLYGGSGIVSSGCSADNIQVISSGYARIYGTLNGGSATGVGHLFIDGTGNNLSAIESGDIFIGSGASASGIYLSSGRMSVNGNASNVVCELSSDYVSVGSGGILTGGNIKGYLVASNGGIIQNTTVGGGAHIRNTGSAASITVSSGGSLNVSSGGTARIVTVSSGGLVLTSDGAETRSCVIADDGSYLQVKSGGKSWNDTATHGPGRIHASSGASVFNPLAESGGYLRGEGNFYNGTVKNGGALWAWPGGYVQGFHVSSGGHLFIYGSASANTVYLSSGGTLTVNSGGTAYNVHSSAGAVVNSSAGAVITYVS